MRASLAVVTKAALDLNGKSREMIIQSKSIYEQRVDAVDVVAFYNTLFVFRRRRKDGKKARSGIQISSIPPTS